jgi:hypothetical protein
MPPCPNCGAACGRVESNRQDSDQYRCETCQINFWYEENGSLSLCYSERESAPSFRNAMATYEWKPNK